MRYFIIILICFCYEGFVAQTFGPNNPASGVNDNAVGTNAWSNPNRIVASNNSRSRVSIQGNTNFLKTSGHGFLIPAPANIDGIRVSVEKRHVANNVESLDAWSTGNSKVISAGTDRALIVLVALENGNGTRDVTAVSYGGRPMTNIGEVNIGNAGAFNARVEAWILLEAGIQTAVGNTITPTFGAFTSLEYCEIISSATYQNVDQITPIAQMRTTGNNGATNPHQLGAALTVPAGSFAVNATMCGHSDGTYTINSAYTELLDVSFVNPGFATTGGTLQVAHKSIASSGTEQPTCTYSSAVNRHAMLGFSIQRAPILDNIVQLTKNGVVVGANRASAKPWPTTEAVTNYGGPADLWGETWSVLNVNDLNFGAVFSGTVRNGSADVDNINITVFSTSTLPVELTVFEGNQNNNQITLNWITASEINNDYFLIEKSLDGITFFEIDKIQGVGNSNNVSLYSTNDIRPVNGVNYYRLKQVDFDGEFEYSDIISVQFIQGDFLAYPNPSENGVFSVLCSEIKVNKIEVFTTDLKHVQTVEYKDYENPIVSIENAPNGNYYLLVHNQENEKPKMLLVSKNSTVK